MADEAVVLLVRVPVEDRALHFAADLADHADATSAADGRAGLNGAAVADVTGALNDGTGVNGHVLADVDWTGFSIQYASRLNTTPRAYVNGASIHKVGAVCDAAGEVHRRQSALPGDLRGVFLDELPGVVDEHARFGVEMLGRATRQNFFQLRRIEQCLGRQAGADSSIEPAGDERIAHPHGRTFGNVDGRAHEKSPVHPELIVAGGGLIDASGLAFGDNGGECWSDEKGIGGQLCGLFDL